MRFGAVIEPQRAGRILAFADEIEVALGQQLGGSLRDRHQKVDGFTYPAPPQQPNTIFVRDQLKMAFALRQQGVEFRQIESLAQLSLCHQAADCLPQRPRCRQKSAVSGRRDHRRIVPAMAQQPVGDIPVGPPQIERTAVHVGNSIEQLERRMVRRDRLAKCLMAELLEIGRRLIGHRSQS